MHCAVDAFEKVLKIKPDDKIAEMWLERLTREV
jgi:predicted TPR repeat methyltransferase